MRGEGEGRHRLRADYRAFPFRASIFQIDNVVGLGDQPGDFHMKRCFPSEINGCYYSLTFFYLLFLPLKALFSPAGSTVSRVAGKRQKRDKQDTVYVLREEKRREERMEKHVVLRSISWHESRILRTMHYILP